MTRYLVTGQRAYREHEPGEEFDATLDRDQEQRAVARGSIRVVRRAAIALDPNSVRPPKVKA